MMKNINVMSLIAASLLSSFSYATTYGENGQYNSDPHVELLVLVEPRIYERQTQEQIGDVIRQHVERANQEFSVTPVSFKINAVLPWINNKPSDQLLEGKSFSDSTNNLFESALAENEAQYLELMWPTLTAEDLLLREDDQYIPQANPLMQYWHADKIILVTDSPDIGRGTEGYAFKSIGTAVYYDLLVTDKVVIAHELGHTFRLKDRYCYDDSVSYEENVSRDHWLMCSDISGNAGLSATEIEEVEVNLVEGWYSSNPTDPHYHLADGGNFSEPMQMQAKAKVSLPENQIAPVVNEIEVTVQLVDDAGELTALTEETSIELYSSAITARSGEHYQPFMQRLVFAAGETEKRVTVTLLNRNTSDETQFEIGTRYGKLLADGEAQTVTLEAVATTPAPTPKPVPAPKKTPKAEESSGGSLSFISLFLLGLCRVFRTQK